LNGHDNSLSNRCAIVKPVSAPDELADQLPLLVADVFEAAGAMRRNGDRLAGIAGQSQARWQVLSVLSQGEWTVPRIARRLGITRQAVQRVVDALRDDGLLRLDANPDHERSPLLRLTGDGIHALETITGHARDWHEDLAAHMSADDLAAARRVLHALIAAGSHHSR
jgi:DNA-binding MarR family transcriptional regulator